MDKHSIITHRRVPYDFAIEDLRRDLAQLAEGDWQKHVRESHYKGQYHGVPLIAVDGSPSDLTTHLAESFKATPLLARCPAFQEALARFKCPFHRVRLMRLDPGARIRRHVDPLDRRNLWIARFHIPIITNDRLEFRLAGERIRMAPGECWFIDPAFPHSVRNRGDTPRIHLVIDCAINDFVNGLLGFDVPKERQANAALYRKYERRHKLQNRIVNRWDNFSRKVRKAAHLSLHNPRELWRLATKRKTAPKAEGPGK